MSDPTPGPDPRLGDPNARRAAPDGCASPRTTAARHAAGPGVPLRFLRAGATVESSAVRKTWGGGEVDWKRGLLAARTRADRQAGARHAPRGAGVRERAAGRGRGAERGGTVVVQL